MITLSVTPTAVIFITYTESPSLLVLTFTLKGSQWMFCIVMWIPGQDISVVAVMSLLQMEVGYVEVVLVVER
jgi:hypothetical protein